MLGEKCKFSGCTVHATAEGTLRKPVFQAPGLRYSKSVASLHLLLFFNLLSDVTTISWFYLRNMMGLRSLRFPTRIRNYAPLPRELMFFSFQICLGCTDSHTLVYFLCVVFYGVCTRRESNHNEFHSVTFIKKQITVVCVPWVFNLWMWFYSNRVWCNIF